MGWVDLKGPIIANTVYSDGQLVAKDTTVTLPTITPLTADFKVMGTMSLPMTGQIESMELTITKIGVDMGLARLSRLQQMNLEFRWAHTNMQADGTQKVEGCKSFIRAIPKTLPAITIEPGSVPENELTYEVTRFQLFVGGAEIWLIDRLAQIQIINGIDYFKDISSLL